ncbi:MAG: extracellular solute-binding protein [Lachnospiraceae bacterium]|nr:extracellular solute-binding protein [Lachnospiraceae bacterium]
MKKSLKLISLLLTLVMVLSLGACGGQKDPSASAAPGQSTAAPSQEQPSTGSASQLAGTYDIKVWCPEAAVELTKQQIDAYNKSNTDGIVINATVEAVGEGDAATSMITDVEAGGDLFFFAQDQTARLIEAGALAKLGKAAAANVQENNDAGAVTAVKSGDEIYAYPLTADNGFFMYYDKSVIPEADLGSMEKLLEDCEKAGKYFSFDVKNGWYVASFFFATGCSSEWEYDDNGKAIACRDNWNSANGLIAAKAIKTFVSSKAYNNSSSGADFAAATPSAIVVSGTWDYNTVKDILGDNLGAAELPSFTVDGKSYHLGSFNGCKLLGVKPQTDAVKQAVLHRVAQYLTNEECEVARFEALGWGPSNLAALANEKVSSPALIALSKQNAYAVPQGQISGGWWDIAKAIPTNIEEATDEAGLQKALDIYKEALAGIIDMPADEATAWTVIGTINEWNGDEEMTEKPAGTWYTNLPIEFKADDKIKVRQGKSWDNNFGGDKPENTDGDGNLIVGVDGWYYVKFVLDGDKGVITLEKNSPSTGWTVIGTIGGSEWTNDLPMELQADGTFKSVEAYDMTTESQFKVRQGGSWDNNFGGDGPDGNYVPKEAGKFYVVFNWQTGEITLSAE